MPTLNGVTYSECHDENRGQIGRDVGALARAFTCAWDSRLDLIAGILGGSFVAGTTFRVISPQLYAAGQPFEAQSASFEPFDGGPGAAAGKAKITVAYGLPDADDGQDDLDADEKLYLEVDHQFHVEVKRIEPYAATDVAGVARDMPTDIPYIIGRLVYVRHNIGTINTALWRSHIGQINMTAWHGFGVGKLMLANVGFSKAYNAKGQIMQRTAVVEIAARSHRWDYDWKPGTGWAEVNIAVDTDILTGFEFRDLGKV